MISTSTNGASASRARRHATAAPAARSAAWERARRAAAGRRRDLRAAARRRPRRRRDVAPPAGDAAVPRDRSARSCSATSEPPRARPWQRPAVASGAARDAGAAGRLAAAARRLPRRRQPAPAAVSPRARAGRRGTRAGTGRARAVPQPQSLAASAGRPAAETLTREQIEERLLEIVSERTGYPADMLELDADLEGDLGIDSIKRVEIAGTFTQSLPASTSARRSTSRSSRRSRTLTGGDRHARGRDRRPRGVRDRGTTRRAAARG